MSSSRWVSGEVGSAGSTAFVPGTRRTVPLSAWPPLSMTEATSAVAAATTLAMSLAFWGDVEVTNIWMRGLAGRRRS